MEVNTLKTHSHTSLINQPDWLKRSLPPYLCVHIMFTKICPEIFMLKYIGLLLNEVYLHSFILRW